jgi:hypothetical protein
MLETLSHNKTAGQAPGEDSIPEEAGEAEDPQDSRTTTQKTLTSIANTMGEATTPKGAQKQREHGKNSARESTNEHCILHAKPVSSELLAAAIRESTIEFCLSSAVSTTTVSMAAVAAIFPSVASDPINPAATTHSGNIATASRKFFEASVKFGTSELQGIAIVRDYHANHGRIRYGIRYQEAEKQLLQICEHHHL